MLSEYHYRCCVTGLDVPGLLNASRIAPWSKDEHNRLNPHNGLCLNVLHHRAFDLGLMTITPSGVIRISSDLRASARKSERAAFVAERDGAKIKAPSKFDSSHKLLKYHNKIVFEAKLFAQHPQLGL